MAKSQYFNLIGSSKQMQTIYETLKLVTNSDANVLIVGESGTGKELIANAIHYNSSRSKQPFIKVNCTALPKELIESELFGHTKGSFTGAHADKDGLLQHAAGGSLLLDEIVDMPIELQPKLLRALQKRSYRKIGSEKTYPVDFRLICTTNCSPVDSLGEGLLRDDLFYRISTIVIRVPPLRERGRGDIRLLTRHFLKMYAQKYDRAIAGVSQEAFQQLFAHTWPGNVRELQNVIERAVLLAKGKYIEASDFPFRDDEKEFQVMVPGQDNTAMLLEKIQRQVIKDQLAGLKLLRVLILNRMNGEMKGSAERKAFVDRIGKLELETKELISHYIDHP